jgi:hypothetical protein
MEPKEPVLKPSAELLEIERRKLLSIPFWLAIAVAIVWLLLLKI